MDELFSIKGTDKFYEDVRNETLEWHQEAKTYWQATYEMHHRLLDNNFPSALSKDSYSRLWELTQAEFLAQHCKYGLQFMKMSGKNVSKPDFCFTINEEMFYIEATCPNTGNCLALNDQRFNVAKKVPITENMERFCSAINEKGDKKYHASYKKYMNRDSGLILSISLAKIPLLNQTLNFENELRCIFGMSPLTIPIIEDNSSRKMGSPYYKAQQSFQKKTINHNKRSMIKTNYFSCPEYSHISAILISYNECVFFSWCRQIFSFCKLGALSK